MLNDATNCFMRLQRYGIFLGSKTFFPCLEQSQKLRSAFPFHNNPKNLDQSYKADLDFSGLFWKEKPI